MDPLRVIVPSSIDETRRALEVALASKGFGILTEIDLQATFRAKLDADHEAHRILGVCKPQLAKQALDLDRDVALLLPCTVTLREVEGGTEVHAIDPQQVFTLAANETREHLVPLAARVRSDLAEAIAGIGAGAH